MEVDVFPLAILFVPDASFLDGAGRGSAACVGSLRETHIANDGCVAHDPNLRAGKRCLYLAARRLFQFKIEAMEIHPLHQLSERFGFEAGEGWVTQFTIGSPVAVDDTLEQAFG